MHAPGRRRFLGTAAMTMAAAGFGVVDTAQSDRSRIT